MSIDPVLFAKVLADDTRQEIMKHLCCDWLSVNDVVDKLDGKVNQPTVSHHLKKLEEVGSGQRPAGWPPAVLYTQPGADHGLLRHINARLCAGIYG